MMNQSPIHPIHQVDLFPDLPRLPALLEPPQSASLKQAVRCAISGVSLGILEVSIIEGAAPVVQNFNTLQIVHPFFQASDYNLLKKLQESLDWCNSHEWEVDARQMERLQILMVAIMDRLGALKSESPGLPGIVATVGSVNRLGHLANWWLHHTTRRIQFPVFSVSRRNDNMDWNNFKSWLDSANEIRAMWDKRKSEIEYDAELRARELASREVRSDSVRRADLKKIWNWIELQLQGNIHPGQIHTMKAIFFTADMAPEEWLPDDIDDLSNAIHEHVDMGNEISHYITVRINNLYAAIRGFYEGFTIVNRAASSVNSGEPSPKELAAENEFFKQFDDQVADMKVLPAAPVPGDYPTLAKFLKAEAQHRLLAARWKLHQTRKGESS